MDSVIRLLPIHVHIYFARARVAWAENINNVCVCVCVFCGFCDNFRYDPFAKKKKAKAIDKSSWTTIDMSDLVTNNRAPAFYAGCPWHIYGASRIQSLLLPLLIPRGV